MVVEQQWSLLYLLIISNGHQVGIIIIRTVLPPPKRGILEYHNLPQTVVDAGATDEMMNTCRKMTNKHVIVL